MPRCKWCVEHSTLPESVNKHQATRWRHDSPCAKKLNLTDMVRVARSRYRMHRISIAKCRGPYFSTIRR
jgi:hypothetical protein